MSKLGKRLINAAKSAQAIAKGEADPKTYKVHVQAYLDVRAIRTKLKMSQNAFAARHPRMIKSFKRRRDGSCFQRRGAEGIPAEFERLPVESCAIYMRQRRWTI